MEEAFILFNLVLDQEEAYKHLNIIYTFSFSMWLEALSADFRIYNYIVL